MLFFHYEFLRLHLLPHLSNIQVLIIIHTLRQLSVVYIIIHTYKQSASSVVYIFFNNIFYLHLHQVLMSLSKIEFFIYILFVHLFYTCHHLLDIQICLHLDNICDGIFLYLYVFHNSVRLIILRNEVYFHFHFHFHSNKYYNILPLSVSIHNHQLY
jgi:hypothetical protein